MAIDAREPTSRREPIPEEVALAVHHRDGGRCAKCGSTYKLQYGHIIPVSMGGATTVENLQLLCRDCNLRKGASLG
jgi:5-methylcytosine-specific restriction endonuclease McrA